MGVGNQVDGADKWWEKSTTQKIDIEAEPEIKISKSGKKTLVRPKGSQRGCFMLTLAVILRLLSIAAGLGMLFVGGWMLYQIKSYMNSGITNASQNAAMGAFLCLAGFLVVLVELRTKRMMTGCLRTYIVIANYMSRGIFQLFVGGLMMTETKFPYQPFGIQFIWIAGAIIGIGGLNVLYFIYYCQYQRKKSVALQPRYVANAEEIAYGMNLYDPEQRRLEEEKRKSAMGAGSSSGKAPAMQEVEFDDRNKEYTTDDSSWKRQSMGGSKGYAPPADMIRGSQV